MAASCKALRSGMRLRAKPVPCQAICWLSLNSLRNVANSSRTICTISRPRTVSRSSAICWAGETSAAATGALISGAGAVGSCTICFNEAAGTKPVAGALAGLPKRLCMAMVSFSTLPKGAGSGTATGAC